VPDDDGQISLQSIAAPVRDQIDGVGNGAIGELALDACEIGERDEVDARRC
jgi:hypothetical protein